MLVVDDEPEIREVIRTTLEGFGYRVVTANAGEQALSRYQQRQSEIKGVILDLMMPGLAWKTIVQRLRHLNPEIKIVAISGLSTDLESLKSEVPGIESVLPKPFTPSELLRTDCRCLRMILAHSPAH